MPASSNVVGVIGAGIMGRGIALACAVAGKPVLLADRDLATARGGCEELPRQLTAAVSAGVLERDRVATVLDQVQAVSSIAEAAATASVVIEAVPEDLQLKFDVCEEISRNIGRTTILASNTSCFDIDDLATHVDDPGRMLGTHWFNPAHIVPCVEVVPASTTRAEVVDSVLRMLADLGKVPHVVSNTPGFVANRIQFAMVREAILCLEEGLAAPETIDEIIRTSFGFRLGVLGPLRIADMAGLDTYQAVFRSLAARLGSRFQTPDLIDRLVEQGELGVKTLRGIANYDASLAAEVASARDVALYSVLRSAIDGSMHQSDPWRVAHIDPALSPGISPEEHPADRRLVRD